MASSATMPLIEGAIIGIIPEAAVSLAGYFYWKVWYSCKYASYSISRICLIELGYHKLFIFQSEKRTYHSVWVSEIGDSCTSVFPNIHAWEQQE